MASVISIVELIVEIPLAFGLIISLLKFYKGEDVKAFDFFKTGFNNFKKAWAIAWNIFLKMIVPFICLVVVIVAMILSLGASIYTVSFTNSNASNAPLAVVALLVIAYIAVMIWFICKSLYYSLAYIIAADDETLTAKEAVEKSKELMTNNRSKLFFLELSFIGWAFLTAFTFGIGMLWLMPYIEFAIFAFYMFLNGSKSTVEVKNEEPSNDEPIQE